MIEYYGDSPAGRPFPSCSVGANGWVYFAWDPDADEGFWVGSNGRQVSRSLIKVWMMCAKTWVRVEYPFSNPYLELDRGL